MTPLLELNRVEKSWSHASVKIALCYPNVYRAGMSGHTIQLLYYLLNLHEEALCERVFKPEEGGSPRSIESKRQLSDFNIVAFTFQYELDYVNFLSMLLSSNIPLRRTERSDHHPLIIAGGPAVWANPCVIEDFVDLFVIGDAEPVIWRLLDLYVEHPNRRRFLEEASNLKGIYVPGLSHKASRALMEDLDRAPHPVRQVLPLDRRLEPVFGRALTLEASRSCSRRCRFCLISWISSPARHRSLSRLRDIVVEGTHLTKVDKVAIVGAGFQDHPEVEEVCGAIVNQGLKLSIPSIRGELLSEEAFKLMVKGGLKTITIAPEVGSEELRYALGKPISNEDLIAAAARAREAGIERLKLYFMIGLPVRSQEDYDASAQLVRRLLNVGFRSIHISISVFIPKANTPLQWLPLANREDITNALKTFKKFSKSPTIKVDMVNAREAELQMLLSLGDTKVGWLLEAVAKQGGRLGAWRTAAKRLGFNIEAFIHHGLDLDGELPWGFIDQGVSSSALKKEYGKAMSLLRAYGSPL